MTINLADTVGKYLYASTPEAKLSTLRALIEAHATARPEGDKAEPLSGLAAEAGFDSVPALLDAIATAPPLQDYIAGFFTTPTVHPAAVPEIIIRPERPVSRTIARLGHHAGGVSILFPEKRDDFREVVRGLDYAWDGEACWVRSFDGWDKVIQATAEIGHRLLAAGFWVAPPTSRVRDLIVEESFEPEHRRKILLRTSGRYSGWFVLRWSRSEDCYEAAKRITAARYDKPVVVVPPEHYDQVEDFAARYNFHLTPAARRAIDEARAAVGAALLVHIEPPEPEEAEAGGVPVLSIPDEVRIDDDLADHD